MKFIVQADDYGMTRAVACGIIHGIKNGIVRNTGLFANMPWANECVEMIRPYLDQIAFGIDLNASTGPSLLGHDRLPNLTHEDGMFLSSKENRALDNEENDFDHVDEQEVYAEFDAQIQRFIELVGKKPDYIHGHAYGTKTTMKVISMLAKKYDVICTFDFNNFDGIYNAPMSWYQWGGSPEKQLTQDLKGFILSNTKEFLSHDYVYLVTHCGYCDALLFDYSSFNTCRIKDLEALTSQEIKQWIVENDITLCNIKELKK